MKHFLYTIDYIKKIDYYLVECQFKIVFNVYQSCQYVTSNLSDKKTLIPWKSWLEEVSDCLKNNRYTFNQIAEKHIITIAKKWISHMISLINKTWMLSNGN